MSFQMKHSLVKDCHDDLMQYKDILRTTYYNCLDVLDYRTNGDDEREAAERLVIPNNSTFVALFERPLQIWKFVSIYKPHVMTDDWTWEHAQRVDVVVV